MEEEKYQNGWPNEPKDLHMWVDFPWNVGSGTAVHNK